MGTPFSPTRQDVERYRRLRAAGSALMQKIANTVPRHVIVEMGETLGVLRNGVLELGSEYMHNVVSDCCIYEWFENGKNLLERYAETHPPAPGTDESYLLNAYLQAKYRVLGMQTAVLDAGVYCDDVLTGEEMFLMDLALSRNPERGNVLLGARTISLGEYLMTCGGALPIDKKTALHALSGLVLGGAKSIGGASSMAIQVVRACLATGAADNVAYANAETSTRPRREPRFPGFKRRRRPAG
jgi:hypothetical protein